MKIAADLGRIDHNIDPMLAHERGWPNSGKRGVEVSHDDLLVSAFEAWVAASPPACR